MDLLALEPVKEGVLLHLRHPINGKLLFHDKVLAKMSEEDKQSSPMKAAITITATGADSERYRNAQQASRDAAMKAAQKGAPFTSAQIDDHAIDVIVACVVGWTNIEIEGKFLDFSRTNVRMMFDKAPWALEQVQSFIGERANFMKASSES